MRPTQERVYKGLAGKAVERGLDAEIEGGLLHVHLNGSDKALPLHTQALRTLAYRLGVPQGEISFTTTDGGRGFIADYNPEEEEKEIGDKVIDTLENLLAELRAAREEIPA